MAEGCFVWPLTRCAGLMCCEWRVRVFTALWCTAVVCVQLATPERYLQWKANVPLLYDWMSHSKLMWPSLSVAWGACVKVHTTKQTAGHGAGAAGAGAGSGAGTGAAAAAAAAAPPSTAAVSAEDGTLPDTTRALYYSTRTGL